MGISAAVVGIISALATAGVQAYSAVEQKDQAKKANEESRRQADEQNRLMKEAQDRQAGVDAEAKALDQAQQSANQARQKQRAKALASGGRQGTILTSPLGVTGAEATTGAAASAGKTILGG